MSGPVEPMFPVLLPWREEERRAYTGPRRVPWELLAPHQAQARRNHMQSLERLATRGGLSPCEMVAVLEDRPWRKMSDEEASAALTRIVDESATARGPGK